MARLAGKMRGDLRALEEQRNSPRTNPVRGAGATPSMGLSQYRGGMSGCGDSESDEELQGGALERMVGAGRGCGTGAGTGAGTGGRKRRGKSMNEATAMGLHLGKHLHSLHGAGFFDDFGRGFMSVIRPAAGIAKSVAPLFGPEGAAVSGVLGSIGLGKARRGRGTGAGQLTITHGGGDDVAGGSILSSAAKYLGRKFNDPNSLLSQATRGTIDNLPLITKMLTTDFKPQGGRRRRGGASVADTGAYEGQGRERDDVEMLQGSGFLSDMLGNIPLVGGPASAITGMFGLGNNGGRKKRAPAGPNDGRRRRAEIVKKVMADKGCSMIEASKYVKAHGLY